MKSKRLLYFLAAILVFSSCKTTRIPQYLEQMTDTTGISVVHAPELRIQKNDLLTIQIVSLSLYPDQSDNIYNLPSGGSAVAGTAATSTPPGYLVDYQGNILHHRLGLIKAEGLTKEELAVEIKKRLTHPVELLSDPTVIVRISNFKVTVLGQVNREGVLTVPGEKLTVIEAIGMAGGINDYGKKTSLRVIREANGKRETGILDITSKDIFNSPFYHMMQNDVVIVEATNLKFKDADQANMMRKISFAFTLVTVASTIANIFIRN